MIKPKFRAKYPKEQIQKFMRENQDLSTMVMKRAAGYITFKDRVSLDLLSEFLVMAADYVQKARNARETLVKQAVKN